MATIQRSVFGHLDGHDVFATTLTNSRGLSVEVIDYGAIVRRVLLPTEQGPVDVVLGLDDLDAYLGCTTFFGAIVGRVANRIAHAAFELDGKKFDLAASDPPHHLHGGTRGFDKISWTSTAGTSGDNAWVRLTYVSHDGEEGYPGEVTSTVTYTVTHENALRVDMTATTTERTLVALAHHSYWNLAGHDSGTLAEHTLTLYADEFTPGAPVVPDGTIRPTRGTMFDLTKPTYLNSLATLPGSPPGFDHNFVVRGPKAELRPVGELLHIPSGRQLTLSANQPGVQVYTGNFLDGSLCGKGASYPRHSAVCLETQAFPNAINVPAWREQVLLEPGQTYKHTMIHALSF